VTDEVVAVDVIEARDTCQRGSKQLSDSVQAVTPGMPFEFRFI
jgi:hypothetical protein